MTSVEIILFERHGERSVAISLSRSALRVRAYLSNGDRNAVARDYAK